MELSRQSDATNAVPVDVETSPAVNEAWFNSHHTKQATTVKEPANGVLEFDNAFEKKPAGEKQPIKNLDAEPRKLTAEEEKIIIAKKLAAIEQDQFSDKKLRPDGKEPIKDTDPDKKPVKVPHPGGKPIVKGSDGGGNPTPAVPADGLKLPPKGEGSGEKPTKVPKEEKGMKLPEPLTEAQKEKLMKLKMMEEQVWR